MDNVTTIKVSKEVSTNLLIAAKLNSMTKEELTDKILIDGLKPYLEDIKRKRFS